MAARPAFQFSVLDLLIFSTVIAVVASFADGALLVLLGWGVVFWAILWAWRWGVWYFRMSLALRLVAPCFARGRLWMLRLLCGRDWVVWGLSHHAAELMVAERHDIAIPLLDEALRLNPNLPENWRNRGVSKWHVGDLQEAESDLSRAIALDPRIDDAQALRGCLRTSLQNWSEAIQDLTSSTPYPGGEGFCAHCRGVCYESLENWSEAYDAYVEANQLNESDFSAAYMVARLQACCPDASIRDGEKAVANALRVCVQTGWENWATISVLAAAYAEVGDFESAIRHAETALELTPEAEKAKVACVAEQFKRGVPYRIEPCETWSAGRHGGDMVERAAPPE
ncbi:Tetratricopeptide repeat protein [Posidoniimonas polymericola]|uniref:Tetratricopeptide repeat protein n=1 Tax=Posidoniimonas polymericola TaxID=2528002 RepID=A0A5C5YS24_9BACT|nr:tetratricopeptide repeat protein [Posidoniimonas polymericola]TWT77497.1 Tetratricopeptide repeat protein [Posidoniimonas polymericola]